MKWGPFWNPLLDASGELLGLSWEGLGSLLGALGRPKWGPRRWGTLTKSCLLSHLAFFCAFFRSGAPPEALLGGFWYHLGAILAHLDRVLVPSERHLGPSWDDCSRILANFWIIPLGFWDSRWKDDWHKKSREWIVSKSPGPTECAKRLKIYIFFPPEHCLQLSVSCFDCR